MNDYVVLTDENNTPTGTMPKLEAHSDHTPLHRGFSLFLFNTKGELLLQQRSRKKKTWPGVWSNSVCGHPMTDESAITAAKRRLAYELGIEEAEITMALPDYRYRFERNGIVENEFCPVMIGVTNHQPQPNTDEVEATKWISWKEWTKEVKEHSELYSEWCIEETELLKTNPALLSLLEKYY